jgi:hypothetical protein
LFDFPNLRRSIPDLESVSTFISAKNIDPSIVKNEMNSLPGFKEDLIRGFDISNGTRNLPAISNKLPSISPDGSIVGSFNNGQFVPNGNAIIAGRKYDYIVKSDGQIVVGQKHTFMSQGEDVLGAGEIKFNGAELPVDINNLSGHYQPTPGEAMNFLRAFQQQGVATDNIFLSMYNADGTIFRQIHPNANARTLYHQ